MNSLRIDFILDNNRMIAISKDYIFDRNRRRKIKVIVDAFGVKFIDFNANTDKLSDRICIAEVERCTEFISNLVKIKNQQKDFSSYSLKHQVEEFEKAKDKNRNNYVSNGAFIFAMIKNSFTVFVDSCLKSPNAEFNFSISSYRKIRETIKGIKDEQ